MSTRSMDKMRDDYIECMGSELGSVFYELSRKLVQLHVVWQQYRQLFGDSEATIALLNRAAGLFFRIVQDELWDSVLLGISRMTDPPAMRKNKNLTIQSIPLLIKDESVRSQVEALCNKAIAIAEFAREHRNKRIAHQDHEHVLSSKTSALSGISRKQVEEMLSALRDVLNFLEKHYRDSTVLYEQFIDESGARVLVQKLERLERLQR